MTDPMQTDLHSRIMNLPCKDSPVATTEEIFAYRDGHRDARHAAAELVASEHRSLRDALQLAKSRIAELEGALQAALNAGRGTSGRIILDAQQEASARAALKEDSE